MGEMGGRTRPSCQHNAENAFTFTLGAAGVPLFLFSPPFPMPPKPYATETKIYLAMALGLGL